MAKDGRHVPARQAAVGSRSPIRSDSVADGVLGGASRISELVHENRVTRWIWYVARLAILLGAGLTRVYLNEHPIIAAFLLSLALALLLLLDCSEVFKLWACFVIGIFVFTHLRTLADVTFISARYLYVIEADRLLFFGNVPTVWLQDRFYQSGSLSILDRLLAAVHFSYFAAPYAMAGVLTLWSRRHFALFVSGALATFYLGLAIYFLVPTSPPWLASEEGFLPEVTRIVKVIGTDVSAQSYAQGHRVVGSNNVAAMPSLHFAITVVIMLALWRVHWVLRALAVCYTALMGFALVYLGEHYVIDLVVGFVVALAGWWIGNWLNNRYLQGENDLDTAPSSRG